MAVTLRINTVGGEAEISGDTPHDLIMQASFWSSLPTVCPVCYSPLTWRYTVAQDKHKFYALVCTGEQPHDTNLGQKQDGNNTLYYKGDGLYKNPNDPPHVKAQPAWGYWDSERRERVGCLPGSGAEKSVADSATLGSTFHPYQPELNVTRAQVEAEFPPEPEDVITFGNGEPPFDPSDDPYLVDAFVAATLDVLKRMGVPRSRVEDGAEHIYKTRTLTDLTPEQLTKLTEVFKRDLEKRKGK